MSERRIGVLGATMVGIGGIVGGGVLVLAGVAFDSAGPAAVLAFALNGVVAYLTAMSISEMSTAFPESGGVYTFAKKVLSVRAAFAVGWVLWFAYIVGAVLYALSFGAFATIAIGGLVDALGGTPPAWLHSRGMPLLLATTATAIYSLGLARREAGGGRFSTIGKVVLFSLLILAGVLGLMRQPIGESIDTLDPFLVGGASGLIAAMGFTFISIQGFEMVAAIAGEIREPRRTIPRAMFLSLTVSLAIYLPLLFVMATAGVEPGQKIGELAHAHPDTVAAVAVERFLGQPGYWLVVVAIVLATLSALHANLLIASRVSLAMASDRALPEVLKRRHPARGTPIMAIYATALTVVAILFMVPDLAGAGAAASLIFLVAFTLSHVTAFLARRRGGLPEGGYRTPAFPLIPVVGGLSCAGLAVFQAVVVPDAGSIALIWLGLGVILYVALFKTRAETADASAEAMDPRLGRLRGKSPLVLLPIANPKNARSLVEVANALAPTEFARVLLLTIVRAPREGAGDPLAQLADAQNAVREALLASYSAGHAPEALITAAAQPWPEIRRVAEEHDCESLLIGLSEKGDAPLDRELEDLINDVDCDVAVMRAPADWRVGGAKRVLVPVGGRGEEHELRARLLATLCRDMPREIRFLTVMSPTAGEEEVAEQVRMVTRVSDLNIPGVSTRVEVVRGEDPSAAILAEAATSDLLVLGLRQSRSTGRKVFGKVTLRIARSAPCAVILLSKRPALVKELYRPLKGAVQLIPLASRRADTLGE
jgi:amino acid transporter/nucleotide-binding universal stress UspA family protein